MMSSPQFCADTDNIEDFPIWISEGVFTKMFFEKTWTRRLTKVSTIAHDRTLYAVTGRKQSQGLGFIPPLLFLSSIA